MIRHWCAYAICPIDFGWNYLDTLADAMVRVGYGDDFDEGTNIDGIIDFQESFDAAKTAARYVGFEGDFRGDPRVFWLPDYDSAGFVYGFVWKQSHGGRCFVISPCELPSIANDCIAYAKVDREQ